MKKYFIVGNWKMNLAYKEAKKLAKDIDSMTKPLDSNVEVVLCSPFIHLPILVDTLSNSAIQVGAQNCNENKSGAFTGEVSAEMIKSYDCTYVILGHSERREYYCESNEIINKKIQTALDSKLKVILCIGEFLEERQENKTNLKINEQLKSCLENIDKNDFENIIIAYEPIWAIGTGLTASNEQINETHNAIRNYLIEIIGSKGISVPILYGGSMNDKNAQDILGIKEVYGGLIGGASLIAESFVQIVKFAEGYSNT